MLKRFEDKYIKLNSVSCWLWTGCIVRGGYGQIRINGKGVYAHRYSYEKNNGAIPEGVLVRHTCNVPSCVNPNHLVLGTHQDNMDDKVNSGRQSKGETHLSSKLTNIDVLSIRKRLSLGHTTRDIAKDFPVGHAQISSINTGKSWSHIL